MSVEVFFFVMIVAVMFGLLFYLGLKAAADEINDIKKRLQVLEQRATILQ